MSPEYFWLKTEIVLVKRFGKKPSSAMVFIRCKASPLASCERLSSHVGPGCREDVDCWASLATTPSSLMRKGMTCGLTWETMK